MTRQWKIGPVEIENPFVLAPMAGITDLPFRELCKEQGAGLLYTEMVSAKAISYRNRNTIPLMEISPGENPVALQIFGSEPELMAEVAKSIEDQPFDILDINMGCPVPKVVNNGEGSALLKNPELIRKIVSAVSRAIKKPVTVKMRVGFEGEDVDPVETAKIMEDSGAAAIAVHGRTRQQYYSGKADWDTIRKIKEAVSVPVIGNGDVDSPKKAEAMLKETGCDAVMIGRAVRGNPWIFREMNYYFETGELLSRPSIEELKEMILRHARRQIEKKGEYTGIREMRKHVAWYTAGMRHSAGIRRESNLISGYEELKALLDRLSQQENKM
ncbi:MAG TPA: tRNA dihydrouridine synthase DusB [Candidatus Blautia intestinipullorum]|nr:tRNA dihydrouridine synthase DusB [Candidatus Blautia intestinipullorum]